jgi:hypothetical protein
MSIGVITFLGLIVGVFALLAFLEWKENRDREARAEFQPAWDAPVADLVATESLSKVYDWQKVERAEAAHRRRQRQARVQAVMARHLASVERNRRFMADGGYNGRRKKLDRGY